MARDDVAVLAPGWPVAAMGCRVRGPGPASPCVRSHLRHQQRLIVETAWCLAKPSIVSLAAAYTAIIAFFSSTL